MHADAAIVIEDPLRLDENVLPPMRILVNASGYLIAEQGGQRTYRPACAAY